MAIPKIDWYKMSLEEITAHIKDAEAVRAEKQEQQRALFMDEMKARAASLGFDLADMFGGAKRGRPAKSHGDGSRASPVPKYASLKDPSKTWSGRGIQPKWMTEEIAENKKLKKEDFRIENINKVA